MAIIRVKRSGSSGSPSALAQGEMAYSFLSGTQANGGDRLYIGTGTETGGVAANIEVIGGKYFTSKLSHVPGVLTNGSAVIVDSSGRIDTFNATTLSAGNTTFTGTLSANGSVGTAGQVLTSNTTGVYWSTIVGTTNIGQSSNSSTISLTSSTGSGTTLLAANSTVAGLLSADAQTIGGVKTFSSTITGSITGNAGTATTLQTARTINSVSFNGSADITITANTPNALTFNNGGTGAVSGSTFNGGSAVTVSYNTVGASPLAGSTSLTTLGTITTGTWNGSVIGSTYGGTGVNNGTNTITLGGNISTAAAFSTSGAFALTLTQTGATNVTLPTTGTLATLAGTETLTNKTLTAPTINGGTHTALTSLGIRSTGTGAFDLTINNTENLTAGRTLTITTGDSARTLSLSGNIVTANSFTTSGNFALTLTQTAATNVTLPTTGTLATLTGTETFTNKTLTSPSVTTSLTTGSASFDLVNTTATTVNFAGAATTLAIGGAAGAQTVTIGGSSTAASTYNLGTGITATATTKTINVGTGGAAGSTTNINFGSTSGTGTATFNNDLVVTGNLIVNGTTTTVNSTTVTVDDINIELGSIAAPTDTTANGGGITLKGTTDKTFNWVNGTASWTSSENLELASGKVFRINGASVLSATALGSGVLSSSLTSVGTIGTGTWQGTTIAPAYGGTGQTTLPAALGALYSVTQTATAAGTTSLTSSSTPYQIFTGTTTQTINLPSTSTLIAGQFYEISNNSTGTLTIQTSTAGAITTIVASTTVRFTCLSAGGLNTAAEWDFDIIGFGAASGTGSVIRATSPVLSTPTITYATTSMTAGTNAQGQGNTTSEYTTVTSTPNNPSGVTLNIAGTGRRVVVNNRGTNPIVIYPSTGGNIDTLGTNNGYTLPVGQQVTFYSSSATQWYSESSQKVTLADTATALATARTIAVAGAVTGSASFDGTGNISINTSVAADAVALGTNTTGNYVATIGVTAGTGLSVTGSGTETAAVTIAGVDATTSSKGVASFNSTDFTVTSGAVALNTIDGGTY